MYGHAAGTMNILHLQYESYRHPSQPLGTVLKVLKLSSL